MTTLSREPRGLLTVQEVARILHVSDDTVRRQIKEGDLPAVRADATRLTQVLTNLLSNAVKYNRAGGSVRVALTASDEAVATAAIEGGLCIWVQYRPPQP